MMSMNFGIFLVLVLLATFAVYTITMAIEWLIEFTHLKKIHLVYKSIGIALFLLSILLIVTYFTQNYTAFFFFIAILIIVQLNKFWSVTAVKC